MVWLVLVVLIAAVALMYWPSAAPHRPGLQPALRNGQNAPSVAIVPLKRVSVAQNMSSSPHVSGSPGGGNFDSGRKFA